MAECLNCGKHYDLAPGDLGSLCEDCAKPEDTSAQASQIDARPIQNQFTTYRVAPITFALIVVNVAIYAFLAYKGGPSFKEHPSDTEFLIKWGAQYGPRMIEGQWWRLVTAIFLHGSISHLGVNMLTLWFLGRQLEQIGRMRYLIVYFLSGIAGGVTSLLWDPTIAAVGASGAIFGLFGVLLSPRNLNRRNLGTLLLFVVILVLPGAAEKQIDYMGHLGGIVAGVVLGLALSLSYEPKSSKSSRRFAFACFALIFFICAGSIYARVRDAYLPDLVRGSDLVEQKKYAEAVPYMQRSLQHRPNSAEANGAVGETLFRAGRSSEAVPYLQKATQLAPKQDESWLLLGLSLLNSGNNDDAIAALLHVTGTGAEDKTFPYYLGLAYARKNDNAKAKEWLMKAADADPGDAKSGALLGHIYLQEGNNDDAFKYLYQAAGLAPENLALQRDLGVAYMRRGNFAFAEGCFARALQLSNGDERDRKALAAARAALARQP
jgi:membrane associated rhomboid family serine protease/Flp pilus assembly protein TadD